MGTLPGRLSPEEAAAATVAGGWSAKSRYDRRAEVVSVTPLTPTGTVRIAFAVADGGPFEHRPGQFVGVEHHVEGVGYARSPYCIFSPPGGEGRFELLVRVVPDGPVSRYLGSLRPGEVLAFRGPTGRSMVPRDEDRDLVLLATGVGVGPFHALASYLVDTGFPRRITLYWGLRLEEDVCLTDELDALACRSPRFSYRISLSRPSPTWTGLRGRVTESVPPLLATLEGTRFYLCGNGAMTEDMATALSDLGAAEELIYQEHYFNQKHVPDPVTLAAIRARFVAGALSSPMAHHEGMPALFRLDRPVGARRGDPAGTGRACPRGGPW
ncbi:MAG TPA: FAD-binding oxidoreductase, partial [Acidimicrobiales bacterium]|nr:FAD-binding oxidoreductase [Acidimicrobiales bacterium]